jgi:hypothetical protein
MTETAGTSYTVAEAAKVVQRSTKRIRQLIAEGRLTPLEGTHPVRLPAEAVHALRDELRTQGGRPGPKPQPQGMTEDAVRTLVRELIEGQRELVTAERQRADEARDRAEEILRDALAEERLRREAAEREAAELREALAEESKRRGIFRRK